MSADLSVSSEGRRQVGAEVPRGRGATARRFVVLGAWLAVLLAWVGVLVGTGTAWGSLATWVLAAVAGVVLPGFVLVRAVRPVPAPLVEDLAWGAAAGCVVAMGGWAVDVALPMSVPPWLFGPVVAALIMVPARARQRVLARPAPGWGVWPNLVLAGAMLFAFAWMTVDFLAVNPPDPGPAGHSYFGDLIYQLALVGQARQSFTMYYPLVAGEPYSYHFFISALLAHLGTGTGVDLFDTVLRLAPATLLPAIVLLAAVVARRVAGRVSAGPIAAVLLVVVFTTITTWWTADAWSSAVIQIHWWASLSSSFGWFAGLAAAGTALAVLRRSPDDWAVPTRLFVPFVVLAVGAKSVVLGVLIGGAGLALLVVLVTRQRQFMARAAIVLGVMVAVFAGSLLTIYRGSSTGLQLHLASLMKIRTGQFFGGLVDPARGPPATLVLVAAAFVLVPLLLRLIGLVVLLRKETRDPLVWFVIGTLIAGLAGMMTFRHPANGEIYFLVMAFPIAVIGSAWGISLLLETRPAGSPWRAAAVIGVGVGALATVVIASLSGRVPPMQVWVAEHGRLPTAADVPALRQLLWWTGPLVALLAVIVGVTVLAYLAAWISPSRRAGRVAAVPVLTVAAVLGTGLFGGMLYLTNTATVPSLSRSVPEQWTASHVTRDQLAAGRWLDEHAGAQDVLAVNRVCLEPQISAELPEPCSAMFFTFAATAQRPIEVGGWAYASRNVDAFWTTGIYYSRQPFWDQARLARELAAFTDPTEASLAELYRHGVRWLVADHNGAPADTSALDRLADRRVRLPTVSVWQLRQPAGA